MKLTKNLMSLVMEILENDKKLVIYEQLILTKQYNKIRDAMMMWFKDYYGDIYTSEDIDKRISGLSEDEAAKLLTEAEEKVSQRLYSKVIDFLSMVENYAKENDMTVEELSFAIILLQGKIARSINAEEDLSQKATTVFEEKREEKASEELSMYR